jgi:hypothetical protein
MGDIKFNCTQCGQHLTVDTARTGATIRLPQLIYF